MTIRRPAGAATSPLAEREWDRVCGCTVRVQAGGCPWACERCGGVVPSAEAEHEDSRCGRCGAEGGPLLWCAGCAGWWHAEPGGGCAGAPPSMRERGGLCPEHSAEYAHFWWGRRTKGAGESQAGAGEAGADGAGQAVPYPGEEEAGPAPPAGAGGAAGDGTRNEGPPPKRRRYWRIGDVRGSNSGEAVFDPPPTSSGISATVRKVMKINDS